jgi:hypothetical protein
MRYTLYAVEVLVDASPLKYELATRYSEGGPGSPLVWLDRAGAEEYVAAEIAPHCEDGAGADAQVVVLSGETDSEDEGPFDQLAATWPQPRSGDYLN